MAPLGACVGLELGRVRWCWRPSRSGFLPPTPSGDWWLVLVVIATADVGGGAAEDLNNTRIEMNLERHQQLLLKARMDALSSQINPHFLFNTLNTVSRWIRF